jgi:diguanylate cyclase (GGDEF)-like protein
MAVVFAAMAVALMGRAVIGWLHPSGPPAETFYDAMGDIVPLANTVGSICVNIGFMIMTTERLSVRFRKHALTDELTELPNRRFFLEQADRLSRRAKKTGAGACILMMDLDHFSDVNERFGHAGGDHALVAFARLLHEQVPPPHIVARYGGEEFCSFLTGVEAIEGTRIAEHLRATLAERPVDIRGQAVKLTVSIGVAALHDGDLAASIRTADDALYQAKARGRNQVVVGERKVAEPRGVKKSMFGLARG